MKHNTQCPSGPSTVVVVKRSRGRPRGPKPTHCTSCFVKTTPEWRKLNGKPVCNACGLRPRKAKEQSTSPESSPASSPSFTSSSTTPTTSTTASPTSSSPSTTTIQVIIDVPLIINTIREEKLKIQYILNRVNSF
ncbi:hypothetical protein CYY_002110 [Polysphondylium violaceum]|uniref:GATA-type domain-containing protein n=1 Tax=Polysphondylium violaceum TaxID=133409 RepID=A0A8J4V9X3_9MYCE|nr:hypothetical protein CYY_002110 [Polysphondylium violaceum]